MNRVQIRHSLILLLTATIWGVAFVAQSVGMDYVGPFTFTCVRSLIGGLCLLPVIAIARRNDRAREKHARKAPSDKKTLLLGGLCCGVILSLASCFQQFGIMHTTVGKAGFITAFYIIIVPMLGLFLGKKCGILTWAGVALALAGLYFLCIGEGLSVGKGDLLVLICAFLFSLHILVIDHFSPLVDGVIMSCVQFFVCALICGVAMLIFEKPRLEDILAAWLPILYAGVLSSGVGYTLQIVAQRNVNPTLASLILSLESVVSVLAGIILLGQHPAPREIAGCVLMFLAIILAQLPDRRATVAL